MKVAGEACPVGSHCLGSCFFRQFVFNLGAVCDLSLKALVGFLQFIGPLGDPLLQGEKIFGFLFGKAFLDAFLLIDILDNADQVVRLALQVAHQGIIDACPEDTVIIAAVAAFNNE